MWDEVQNAIAEVFTKKEKHIIEAVSKLDSGLLVHQAL